MIKCIYQLKVDAVARKTVKYKHRIIVLHVREDAEVLCNFLHTLKKLGIIDMVHHYRATSKELGPSARQSPEFDVIEVWTCHEE